MKLGRATIFYVCWAILFARGFNLFVDPSSTVVLFLSRFVAVYVLCQGRRVRVTHTFVVYAMIGGVPVL